MALVVIAVWLVALAGCVWLGFASIKLMIHGFQRAFAPTFGPPTTPRVAGPSLPSERPVLPALTTEEMVRRGPKLLPLHPQRTKVSTERLQ
jgi:hypothetical protein